MGLNTDPERRALVVQRAWLIAMSGHYADWRAVEKRLLELGYDEAPRWLRDPELREAMNPVCRQSREAFLASSAARASCNSLDGLP